MVLNTLGICPVCKSSWAGINVREDLEEKRIRKVSPYYEMGAIELKNYIKENFTPPYRLSRLINNNQCPDCKTEFK